MKSFKYEDLQEFGISEWVKDVVSNCTGLESYELPPLVAPAGYLCTKEEHKILRDLGYDMFVPEYDGEFIGDEHPVQEDETLVEEEAADNNFPSLPQARNWNVTNISGGVVVVGERAFHLSTRTGGTVGETAGGLISQVNQHLVQSQQSFANVRTRLFRRSADNRYMANTWIADGEFQLLWVEDVWTLRAPTLSSHGRQNLTGGAINVRRRPPSPQDGQGAVVRQLSPGATFGATHSCTVPNRRVVSTTGRGDDFLIPNSGVWHRRASQEWVHNSVTVQIN